MMRAQCVLPKYRGGGGGVLAPFIVESACEDYIIIIIITIITIITIIIFCRWKTDEWFIWRWRSHWSLRAGRRRRIAVIVEVVLSCEWKRKRGHTSTLAARARRLPFHAYTKRRRKKHVNRIIKHTRARIRCYCARICIVFTCNTPSHTRTRREV